MRSFLVGMGIGAAAAAAVLRATRLRHTLSGFGGAQVDDAAAARCIDVASPQIMGDRDGVPGADIIAGGASLWAALPHAERSAWCYLYLASDAEAKRETARIIEVCTRPPDGGPPLPSVHPDPEREADSSAGRRRYAALLRDLRAEWGGRIIHQGKTALLDEKTAPLVHAFAPMLYGIGRGGELLPPGAATDALLRRVWAERIGRGRELGIAEFHPTTFIPGRPGSPTLATLLDLIAEHRPAGIEWFGGARLSTWPVRHFTAAAKAARGF